MTESRQITSDFDIDVETLRERFAEGMQCCLENHAQQDTSDDISPAALDDSMQHLFTILEKIHSQDDHAGELLKQEMDELPNYCIGLLDELSDKAKTLGCDESSITFEQLSIPLALLFAKLNLDMTEVELVANAISNTANHSQDLQRLAELTDVIDVLANMCSAEIKADLDKSNPGRPWRVLNMNQAIIATRSLDPKRMESVFEQLMFHLPEDAPGFFAESIQQMDIIYYPAHVREVMQNYYQLINQPTLH